MSQCWAFNKDGVRCERDAGHPTLHTVSVTWDDSECFSPIRHQLPTGTPEPPVTDISLPPIPMPTPKQNGCVACGHKHPGSECRCGCYEQIG